MDHFKNPFEYLAFNQTHQAVLAHGMTPGEALQRAEQISPSTPIDVLHAGHAGWKIWYFRENLHEAEAEIKSLEAEATPAWIIHTPSPSRPHSIQSELAAVAAMLRPVRERQSGVVIALQNYRRQAAQNFATRPLHPPGA